MKKVIKFGDITITRYSYRSARAAGSLVDDEIEGMEEYRHGVCLTAPSLHATLRALFQTADNHETFVIESPSTCPQYFPGPRRLVLQYSDGRHIFGDEVVEGNW